MNWGQLPALAITEIYEYLSNQDRLNASITCWHWRSVLFQPRFCRGVHFSINRENDKRNSFFLHSLAHLISEAIITFDSQNIYDIDLATEILIKLSSSKCLIKLKIRPKYAILVTPGNYFSGDECNYIDELFIEPIKALLIRRQPPLQVLDIGCSEVLSLYAPEFLKCSVRPQNLKTIALASIKQNASHYALAMLEPVFFDMCESLQILSLDYDNINDEFLHVLQILPLKKLIIHVHGLYEDHPGISELSWFNFSKKLPYTEVHMNLIYAFEAVEVLHSHIFRPSMPLSHLKVLFCHYINIEALEYLSQNYNESLKSVIWIDSAYQLYERNIMDLYLRTDQDPLVMMAWRCKHLQEIVVHGYVIDPHNLVGISRLRGRELNKLEISVMDLPPPSTMLNSFIEEISTQLGKPWLPISDEDLHPALGYWPTTDSVRDKYVLKIVRQSLD